MTAVSDATKNNVAKRHHYLPEFYLKRWMFGVKPLVEFSRPYGSKVMPRRVYPKQTGWVDRLYELRGFSGALAQQIETGFLSPVDSLASKVLTDMEEGRWSWNAKERSGWTRFLISLCFRTPEELAATRLVFSEMVLETDAASELRDRRRRKATDPKTLREAMQNANPDEIDRRSLRLMTTMLNSKPIGQRINDMHWGHVSMPIDAQALLTSDRPIYISGPLEDPDCLILLPVGPKRAFYAVNSLTAEHQLAQIDPRNLADFLNNQTVRAAVKFVYGSSDVNLSFVRANMSTEIRMTYSQRARQRRILRNMKLKSSNSIK